MFSSGENEDWLKVICILLEDPELKRKAFLKEKTHLSTSFLSFGENSPRLKIVRRGGRETHSESKAVTLHLNSLR